jgi:hypothetical protein
VLSKKCHISSDLSDPKDTPVPAVAKDQANVSPLPTALAVGIPGLSWEPGVSHPLDGVLDRQSDHMASSIHSNEHGLYTKPLDDGDSTLSSVENHPPQGRPNHLSQEQETLVNAAQEAMTPDQCNLVDHLNKMVNPGIWFNNIESPISCGEGPSHGKGVDSRNWGAAGIPKEELDLDVK